MGIAACIFCAVATQKMGAGGNTVISQLVGHVTIVACSAGAGLEKRLADSNFVRVVGVATLRTEGARTWIMVSTDQGRLTSRLRRGLLAFQSR